MRRSALPIVCHLRDRAMEMLAMRKRNRIKRKETIEDPSNAFLFVNKYLADYKKELLNDQELEVKILRLIGKFTIKDVVDCLPPKLVEFLEEISIAQEELEENPYRALGCFGPDVDASAYIRNRNNPFAEARENLRKFFEKKKK